MEGLWLGKLLLAGVAKGLCPKLPVCTEKVWKEISQCSKSPTVFPDRFLEGQTSFLLTAWERAL